MTKNETVSVSTEEQSLLQWLKGYIEFRGRGAKTEVADLLGVSPSGLSKILERGSGFDRKTIRLMSLIMSSKDEFYKELMPDFGQQYENLVFIQRRDADGNTVTTWKPATAGRATGDIAGTLDTIGESV
jgi:hypothetical protein